MTKLMKSALSAILACVLFVGCSSGVSEDKPIAEIKKEVETMSVANLESMVAKYTKSIEAKKTEVQKVQAKLKDIPMKELLGKEAKKIKAEISEIGTSVKNLSERLNVYAKALKTKMNEVK